MAELWNKLAFVDEVVDEVEDTFFEMGGKGRVGANGLKGSEVKAAN